jgi:hypothetical protein
LGRLFFPLRQGDPGGDNVGWNAGIDAVEVPRDLAIGLDEAARARVTAGSSRLFWASASTTWRAVSSVR